MPTYTKETALYDTGAIQGGIDGAAQTATSFITQITGGGIMVHPSGDSNSGWKIADALELIKSTVTAFSVALVSGMAKVVIGEASKSHAEIDYHSLQMVDLDGDTYFHVSDLRDASGYMTDVFPARPTAQGTFALRSHVSAKRNIISVKVNNVSASNFGFDVGTGDSVSSVQIDATTEKVEVTYIPTTSSIWVPKAYTIGTRYVGFDVGMGSLAEGESAACGAISHAEGYRTIAAGRFSHSEGWGACAGNSYADYASHAEGYMSTASAPLAHAEGNDTKASGHCSHAEGNITQASGEYSHTQGDHTIAGSAAQTAMGRFNVEDANDVKALIIGNGTDEDNRSNAFAVDWDGDVWSAGSLKVRDPSIDRDATPSADLFSDANALDLQDKDGELIGRVRIFKRSGGAAGIQLLAWNEPDGGGSTTYNGITVQVGNDWSRSYAVTDAEAFRGAIGLGRTQSNLTLSNTSAGTATFVRNAIVASLFVRSLKLSSALASGSSVTIATVPSGYRPPVMAFAHAYNTQGLFLAVESGGAVKVFNYTGASLSTSTAFSATITYVI